MAGAFQWIDGSFTEDVERIQGRAPNDIDVVTFAPLGDGQAQRALHAAHPRLFRPDCKAVFKVDHYFVPTDRPLDARLAEQVAYWYSLWAHRRGDQQWKGFVTVPVASTDADARAWLMQQQGAPTGAP
ncbi:MAG: hypothetical protein KAI47_04025 [Deltaproteobacteria bacterium]|nr:hypothetical protein [Deltaproteobacteria bacterium]